MFTGIIDHLGRVKSVRPGVKSGVFLLEIEAGKLAAGPKRGGSVSVNGVCLTVVKKKGKSLFFNLVRETKKRSTLGGLKAGDSVHLELPLKHGARLEGHFVLGHVDAVGVVKRITVKGREKSFLVGFPAGLRRYFVEKGSVAMDGVSLTLGKVGQNAFWVHLIPHTLRSTCFARYAPGTRVNLEADILAKLLRKV